MTGRKPKTGSIHHAGRVISYDVEHRPRVTRRLHLELDESGGLRVVAPKRMNQRGIRRALQDIAPRVVRFLDQARSRRNELPRLEYRSGECHFFKGSSIPLHIVQPGKGGTVGISLQDDCIEAVLKNHQPGHVKKRLLAWYRQQAQPCFLARLEYFAALAPWTAGCTPHMRLRFMKRTWGNCSSAGLITMNPHLLKAPPECIDYVIAHEICHLKEHNHGPGFYALQEQLYPSWRQARELIRTRGHLYLHH